MQPAPLIRTLFLALLFGLPACASADNAAPAAPAPRGNQPQQADLSALDKPDSGYRFVTRRLLSEDGKRRYRVYIGIPQQPAPEGGFPVLYALDGNAAAAFLDDAAFARLRKNPVVLVLVAPDSSLRIDRAQRAWDYTPPPCPAKPACTTRLTPRSATAARWAFSGCSPAKSARWPPKPRP